MAFPANRLRRLRRTETLRALVRETRLTPESLVYPLFICPGTGIRKEVRSMPGVFNLSIDQAVKEVREARSLGVLSIILFGLPEKKDETATGAWDENGIVQSATRAIKNELPDVVVMGDVCLCEYTSHGHCGVLHEDGTIDTEPSVERLAEVAVNYANAGAHCVAPSDMMDGRVKAIKTALIGSGFGNKCTLMSYAAKFASSLYGPFR
jgi:porphobilinogen synthase